MQDAYCSASLPGESQTELPCLWLHPVHTLGNGPAPCRIGASPAHPTNIQDLVDMAVRAIQKFSEAVGSRDWRCLTKHRMSFDGPGLIIHALADDDVASSWPIPLRFSEVTHFQTQAGTLFLLIALRKISEQPGMEDLSGPFEKYWVIGVSSMDETSPRAKAALPKLLAKIGVLGAVRLDLHESYDIAHKAIGTGSCASVYLARARDPSFSTKKGITQHEDKFVAVKISTTKSSHLALKETGFLMSLAQHQNIISFHGVFKIPDPASDVEFRWAIMMDHCSAGDLNEFVKANGPCSELRSAEIMFGLLSALSHLHSQGIVHRDVKAENILLMDQGRPVLADLGIAAYLDDAQAMTKKCGTPGHCAPEIVEEREYNAKVDVFGSGVVLYFIVSGNLPFFSSNMGHMLMQTVRCKVKMDAGHFQIVSSNVKSLIKLFLRKDPEERPESSAALQQIVLAYGTHLRASSLLPGCATDAPEPAREKVVNVGGATMTWQSQTNAASPLDTKDCLERPSFSAAGVPLASCKTHCMHASEVSSGDDYEDESLVCLTPRGTSYMQAPDDPSNLSMGGAQDQVMDKRRQRSKCLNSDTSDRPVPSKGAWLSAGAERSGRQWSSQGRDLLILKQPRVGFRRFSPISSVRPDAKRPHSENASPKDGAGFGQQADGDSSNLSPVWMPHAPPSDEIMWAKRRPVPFLQRCQQMAKYKQTNTLVAHKQGISPSSFGSETMAKALLATSQRERPSASWLGNSSKSDVVRPSCDNDMFEDSTCQEMLHDSLLFHESLSLDGVRSKLGFPKPSTRKRHARLVAKFCLGEDRESATLQADSQLQCEQLR